MSQENSIKFKSNTQNSQHFTNSQKYNTFANYQNSQNFTPSNSQIFPQNDTDFRDFYADEMLSESIPSNLFRHSRETHSTNAAEISPCLRESDQPAVYENTNRNVYSHIDRILMEPLRSLEHLNEHSTNYFEPPEPVGLPCSPILLESLYNQISTLTQQFCDKLQSASNSITTICGQISTFQIQQAERRDLRSEQTIANQIEQSVSRTLTEKIKTALARELASALPSLAKSLEESINKSLASLVERNVDLERKQSKQPHATPPEEAVPKSNTPEQPLGLATPPVSKDPKLRQEDLSNRLYEGQSSPDWKEIMPRSVHQLSNRSDSTQMDVFQQGLEVSQPTAKIPNYSIDAATAIAGAHVNDNVQIEKQNSSPCKQGLQSQKGNILPRETLNDFAKAALYDSRKVQTGQADIQICLIKEPFPPKKTFKSRKRFPKLDFNVQRPTETSKDIFVKSAPKKAINSQLKRRAKGNAQSAQRQDSLKPTRYSKRLQIMSKNYSTARKEDSSLDWLETLSKEPSPNKAVPAQYTHNVESQCVRPLAALSTEHVGMKSKQETAVTVPQQLEYCERTPPRVSSFILDVSSPTTSEAKFESHFYL